MKALLYVAVLAVLFLAGCGLLPAEPTAPVPPPLHVPLHGVLQTAPVMRGDVVRYTNPPVFLVPTRSVQLRFARGGLPVAGMYVTVGDTVQAGQRIASLHWPELEARIAATLRSTQGFALALEQHTTLHNHTLAVAYVTGIPVDDSAYLAEAERLQHELWLLELEMAYLQTQNAERFIYAYLCGVVLQAQAFATGMVSNAAHVVATIADDTYTIFELRSRLEADMARPGDVFTLTWGGVPLQARVVYSADYGVQRDGAFAQAAHLVLLPGQYLPPGATSGTMRMVHYAAYDVLYVPLVALRRSGTRTFVYVVDEEGRRSVRDVQHGIRGNASYHIIYGLEEGEVVFSGR